MHSGPRKQIPAQGAERMLGQFVCYQLDNPTELRQHTPVDTTQAQLRQMQHRLKYLEQEIEFYKKYSLPEVRESKGRGHERSFNHLFPNSPDTIQQ